MNSYVYYIFILKNLFQNLFGTHYPTEIITLIILRLYKPIQIVARYNHIILIGDKTYVWGCNDSGQLGLGDIQRRNSPQELPLRNIKLVSCGDVHTIALTLDDQIYVWGSNQYGQLGLGDEINRISPQQLEMSFFHDGTGVSQIKSIVCGWGHTVVLTFDGKIYVWGYNVYGQLGLGDYITRSSPQELILDNIESIYCGGHHTIALTSHNTLYIWGDNTLDQLGLGYRRSNAYLPQKLSSPQGWIEEIRKYPGDSLSNIGSISCGGNFTIALTLGGSMYSWGYGGDGQLGLGDKNIRCVPRLIELYNIKLINSGWDHTVAITESGKIYVWGDNSVGQLGLGYYGIETLPQELIIKNIDTIICGGHHTFAISSDNDVYVWGNNEYGQLGLGDNNNRNLPCRLDFKFE